MIRRSPTTRGEAEFQTSPSLARTRCADLSRMREPDGGLDLRRGGVWALGLRHHPTLVDLDHERRGLPAGRNVSLQVEHPPAQRLPPVALGRWTEGGRGQRSGGGYFVVPHRTAGWADDCGSRLLPY